MILIDSHFEDILKLSMKLYQLNFTEILKEADIVDNLCDLHVQLTVELK